MDRDSWLAPEMPQNGSSAIAARPLSRGALWKLRLGQALVIPEVLATFAVMLLAMAFLWLFGTALELPWWSSAASLAIGGAAITVLLLTAVGDPELIEMAVQQALQDAMRVDRLRDQEIRRLVLQIISARAHMERLRVERHSGLHDVNLTLRAVDGWLAGIGRLVQVIEPVQHEHQAQSVQKFHLIDRIQELEARINMASNRSTTEQLRETMAARRMQLRAIEDLENVLERGLLRLEHAGSALGAMDAKLALLVASGSDTWNVREATLDFDTELSEIDAVTAALQRVYSGVVPVSAE